MDTAQSRNDLKNALAEWKRKAYRIEQLIHRAARIAKESDESVGEAYFEGKSDGLNLAWHILNGDVGLHEDPFEDILGPE